MPAFAIACNAMHRIVRNKLVSCWPALIYVRIDQ